MVCCMARPKRLYVEAYFQIWQRNNVWEPTPRNESGSRRLTAYYWKRGFVLLAPSFSLDRSENPYRRLSAT
jgi:hypothetical protein